MKKIIYLVAFVCINMTAQNKFITKTGVINFEASVPSFEEVAAKNNSVTAIINTENGEFAALALVKGFRFKNALMEEHFNENYAESDQFPKATFKGKIDNFDLKKDTSTYNIEGSLAFHGKTKVLKDLAVTINIKENTIIMSGKFVTKASDFDIDIPKIVSNKIAEDVMVSFEFELNKK
ncbi:YceI family protein [uncultured Psychroserpens sp.]|uniref:YceI family protein n=1 Tax=uncultured Psychroserpens sp. TaxID=255436 RepID=UPI00260AB070|nr:YceI family protein [uncultured Psychroserpens sp.]